MSKQDLSGVYHTHHAPKVEPTDDCLAGRHTWYTFQSGMMKDIEAGRPDKTWVACGHCQIPKPGTGDVVH